MSQRECIHIKPHSNLLMKSTKFKGGHASLLLYKYSKTVPKTQYIMRILCKIVCILCVYYKYIASILLSDFYSNLRTLTAKIRTIKPRKHRISGVRFYQLADTLCQHSFYYLLKSGNICTCYIVSRYSISFCCICCLCEDVDHDLVQSLINFFKGPGQS